MKTFLTVVLLSQIASATPLSDAIDEADSATKRTMTATAELGGGVSELMGRYLMTNAGACALLIAGLNSDGMLAISFIPGPTPISGLQADILTDVPIAMVMPGPATDAAGKFLSSSALPDGRRFLIVGFNQNAIGSGEVAMAHYDILKVTPGPHRVSLVNFSASSPDGIEVPLCATSGVITK